MFADRSYKSTGDDPCKLVSRLGYLSFLIGDATHYNCKSGKDRTGLLDVEAKLLASRTTIEGAVPDLDDTSHDPGWHRTIALGSGNLKVQALNTGLPGFKLGWSKMNAIVERLGGEDAWTELVGLSGSVSS